ncbi:MAG: hypothetical protein J7J87_02380 [Candidatus Diapherotrites archaeon]|nr:hypothetical protein [Candidatus Diapherotrites archaeon]
MRDFMALFNWLQKKIAYALLEGPKSIEQLSKILAENPFEIEKALKQMLELKVVNESAGLFSLSEEVKKGLKERREAREKAKPKLDIQAYIEVTSISEKKLKAQLETIEKRLKNDPSLVVYSLHVAEPVKQKEEYSAYIELTAGFRDFLSLVRFMYFYGPSTVEVVKPAKAEFTAYELQEGLNEMAELIFKYNTYVAKHFKKTELEEFYKKLFREEKK